MNVNQSDRQTAGQLSERPLAELVREIIDADSSGAIRLSHGPAKVVVYFEKGAIVFAASNLRAHRLREVLKRHGSIEGGLSDSLMSDEEVGTTLLSKGAITPAGLQEARGAQAAEVLRVALLWTEGDWAFDARVRVPSESRVTIDIDRLLLECARHLALPLLKSRLANGTRTCAITERNDLPLSPIEARTLARIIENGNEVNLAALATNGLREPDVLRGVYALLLAGVMRLHDSATVPTESPGGRPRETKRAVAPASPKAAAPPAADLDALFNRLESAKTHYEVLDVGKAASLNEIKAAYHDLARQYHPDRFHQSDLRPKVESAFARIGRAYETLSEESLRRDYDKTLSSPRSPATSEAPKTAKPAAAPVAAGPPEPAAPVDRAQASFQLGTQALERHQYEEAIRYFAEAAMLAPRVASYRAYYGSALMRNPNMRRTAETELQAALKIEPNNAAFRVMLAELYQKIGLRKRAENEAARALSADPTNASARRLLSDLSAK